MTRFPRSKGRANVFLNPGQHHFLSLSLSAGQGGARGDIEWRRGGEPEGVVLVEVAQPPGKVPWPLASERWAGAGALLTRSRQRSSCSRSFSLSWPLISERLIGVGVTRSLSSRLGHRAFSRLRSLRVIRAFFPPPSRTLITVAVLFTSICSPRAPTRTALSFVLPPPAVLCTLSPASRYPPSSPSSASCPSASSSVPRDLFAPPSPLLRQRS